MIKQVYCQPQMRRDAPRVIEIARLPREWYALPIGQPSGCSSGGEMTYVDMFWDVLQMHERKERNSWK